VPGCRAPTDTVAPRCLLLIIAGIVVVLALAVLLIYNRMIARRNAVDSSWAQIEAALQQRHDRPQPGRR
jgi:hypothetical protein